MEKHSIDFELIKEDKLKYVSNITSKDLPNTTIELLAINEAMKIVKSNVSVMKKENKNIDNSELYKNLIVTFKTLNDLRIITSLIHDNQNNLMNDVNNILEK